MNKNLFLREVVLYGPERHVFEFAYMFSECNIIGFATNDKITYPFDIEKLSISDVKNKVNDGALLVICDLEKEKYTSLLSNNWCEGEHYIMFEALFSQLDKFTTELLGNRKVVIWGTGDTVINMLNACKENDYIFNVEFYVDGDEKKKGTTFNGREVVTFDSIRDKESYFYIIASIYYFEIKESLERIGLQEGKDFLGFSSLMTRPSKMMSEQIRAKQVGNFFCTRPYNWFYYSWFGTYCCCSTWVKYPIGNPACDTPEEAWNSCEAKLYRLSMVTKTFSFCKREACGISGRGNGNISDVLKSDVPRRITLGLDYSCNLYCTSCRDCIKISSGNQFNVREQMADRIIETGWLDETDVLELSGTGEALLSKIDQKILFTNDNVKRNSISLMTNGVLLNKANWDRLSQNYEHIRINISIDAASEETYNKIRRGGNWKILQQNLEMLSDLRKNGAIEYIEIRMVVQRSNFEEIPQFVEMGKKYGFDKVVFTKLLNWDMYSTEEYLYESLTDENGCAVAELHKVLNQPILKESIVVMDELKKIM